MFTIDKYDDILKEYVKQSIQNPKNELEIRFADSSHANIFPTKVPANTSKQPSGWTFKPTVSRVNFLRIMQIFNVSKSDAMIVETSNGVDTFYKITTEPKKQTKDKDIKPQKTIIRHGLHQNSMGEMSSIWMTKRRSKPIDIWNVNMRISFSSENILNRTIAPHNSPFMIRRKKRTSFTDRCVRYDFTEVVTELLEVNLAKKDTTFEIEIEFLPKAEVNVSDGKNHLKTCIMHLLKLLQDSPEVITLTEKHNVLLEYSVLSGCFDLPKPRFVGAQPETLHKRHLPLIKKKSLYSISEKYDGERFLLFISDNGRTYSISRGLKVKCTGLQNMKDRGTLMDAEYVNGVLFAFDILFYKGKDLRGNINYLLKDRLQLVREIVNTFNSSNVHNKHCLSIFPKEYHFEDFGSIVDTFAENKFEDGIERDGFIYTPVKEYYPTKPKWSNLLKWKPPTLNSIDFIVKKAAGNDNKWNLYVGDKESTLIPFTHFPSIHFEYEKWSDIVGEGNISDNLGVIECIWDFDVKTFVPIRKRADKLSPNFITVALDVWESLRNPVNISDLQTKSFINMRKLHNDIKAFLIKDAIENIPKPVLDWADAVEDDTDEKQSLNVLDLACGRGGDLWKWSGNVSNNYKLHYVGVDVNKDLLGEANNRSRQVLSRYTDKYLHFEFHEQDLRYKCFDKYQNFFDIVSCQFALHYFFESPHIFNTFIESVKVGLKNNGIFICSLFDGLQVYDLCKNKDNVQLNSKDTSYHGFQIIPEYDDNITLDALRKQEFSIAINAVLLGDDQVILKTSTKEYIVFADLFVNRMKAHGFILVETRLFNEFDGVRDTMTSKEQMYSNLHRYYAFSYNSTATNTYQYAWENITSPSDYPFIIHDETCQLCIRLCNKHPCVDELCSSKLECIHSILESITGIHIPEKDADFVDISIKYKLNIGLVSDHNHNYSIFTGDPDSDRMIWIEHRSDHFHILAFKDGTSYSFWFPITT